MTTKMNMSITARARYSSVVRNLGSKRFRAISNFLERCEEVGQN